MALAASTAYALLQKKAPAAKPTPYGGYVHSPGANPAGASAYTKAAAAAVAAQRPVAPPTTAPPAPPSSQSSQQDAANNGAGSVPGAAGSYIPGQGIYAQDSAAAYDAWNAANAAAEKDSQSAKAQYGFNAQGSNLDPYNSTGLFQRLTRAQAQTSAADQEEALSRGLGGTGLGAQVGEQHNFQNQADLADLTNGYQGMLAAALAKKGDANTTLTNALLSARQNQLNYDLQNQLFNAFNSSGDGAGDGSGDRSQDTPNPPSISPGDGYYDPKTGKIKMTAPGGRATIGQAYAS